MFSLGGRDNFGSPFKIVDQSNIGGTSVLPNIDVIYIYILHIIITYVSCCFQRSGIC